MNPNDTFYVGDLYDSRLRPYLRKKSPAADPMLTSGGQRWGEPEPLPWEDSRWQNEVPLQNDTVPPDPLAEGEFGYGNSWLEPEPQQAANRNLALVRLQGMTATAYKDQPFFNAEDKKQFKAIYTTEQELALSVHNLRQNVDSIGHIDAQAAEVTQTLAQLNDQMSKLNQALSHPNYRGQHAQITARLKQLQQQKEAAEKNQARLQDARKDKLAELQASKAETKALADQYKAHADKVKSQYEALKSNPDKSTTDLKKASFFLKQAHGMKATGALIGDSLSEVDAILAGQTAPVLNVEEEAPITEELVETPAAETSEEAEGEPLPVKDVLEHLGSIAQFANGLKLSGKVQSKLKTAQTDEDIEKAFEKPSGQGENAFQIDNSLMTVYKFLQDPEHYEIKNEKLWEQLKPILNLTPQQREKYKEVVKYMMTHYDDVRLAQDNFFGDSFIDVDDLKAIQETKTQSGHRINKDLTEILGTPSESAEAEAESSPEASAESGAEPTESESDLTEITSEEGEHQAAEEDHEDSGTAGVVGAAVGTAVVGVGVAKGYQNWKKAEAAAKAKQAQGKTDPTFETDGSKTTGEVAKVDTAKQSAENTKVEVRQNIAAGDLTLKKDADAAKAAEKAKVEVRQNIAAGDFTLKKDADAAKAAQKSTLQQLVDIKDKVVATGQSALDKVSNFSEAEIAAEAKAEQKSSTPEKAAENPVTKVAKAAPKEPGVVESLIEIGKYIFKKGKK